MTTDSNSTDIETTGEHAFAISHGSTFHVSKDEPAGLWLKALHQQGARVWPVIGYVDGCAHGMNTLVGSWGGKWWFRTGPDFTRCAHCGHTLRSKADKDTHGDWCAALD